MTYITVAGVFTTSVVNLSKLELVCIGLDVGDWTLIGIAGVLIGMASGLIGINWILIGIKLDLIGFAHFYPYKNPFTGSEGTS